jgi:hypothetical protein
MSPASIPWATMASAPTASASRASARVIISCGTGEPEDPTAPQSGYEWGRENSHDGRHHRWRRRDESLALQAEVGQATIAGRRFPLTEELPHPRFGSAITHRWRIANPEVEPERAVALMAKVSHPDLDLRRAHHKRTQGTHAARNRQAKWHPANVSSDVPAEDVKALAKHLLLRARAPLRFRSSLFPF